MTITPAKPGLFLDRDGVLNKLISLALGHKRAPWKVAELEIPDDTTSTLRQVELQNLTQIVITNQPDIARSKMSVQDLNEIHGRLREKLPSINAIYVCPHDNADRCHCRKPLAGLFLRAAHDWKIDLEKSLTIGDRWVDIAAGKLAGTTTVLLQSEHSWLPNSSGSPPKGLRPDYVISSITELPNLVRR